MTAKSHPIITSAHSTRFPAIVFGTIIGLVVWLLAWSIWNGPAAQAALQQTHNSEIAEESRKICQKWGMPAGSANYDECMSDLNAVRLRHEERIMQGIDIF